MIFVWSAYYFQRTDDIGKAVLETFKHATSSIHYMVNTITLPALQDVLLQKAKEGMPVGLVVNTKMASSAPQLDFIHRLIDGGIEVTFGSTGMTHQKLALIDMNRGITDNNSFAAFGGYDMITSSKFALNSWEAHNLASICKYWVDQYESIRHVSRMPDSSIPQLCEKKLPDIPGWEMFSLPNESTVMPTFINEVDTGAGGG